MAQRSAIVVGAGIVGLAMARAVAVKGYRVTVVERNIRAIGASVRNFGMIWPVAQPDGPLYERAIRSRNIWKEICDEADLWYEHQGSLQVAYQPDELKVLQELQEIYRHRGYRLLTAREVLEKSSLALPQGLLGGLYSPNEMVVDPTRSIDAVAHFLEKKYGVVFINGKAVTRIAYPAVFYGQETLEADEIFVCSGSDFENLYPELFDAAPITKCKLQMMRLAAKPGQQRIGPLLCGGLSLIHYASFKPAPSLRQLSDRLHDQYPEEIKWGIHVMASQHEHGNITIGDSHEYGAAHDPFDKQVINELVLKYLFSFADLKDHSLHESWNGIYAKMTDGRSEYIVQPESGVTVVNGLGGGGMTLSFGLCEELVG